MDKKSRQKLLDICVEIFASSRLDYEVTLGGNGTNASEASNVAVEILDIIGVERNSPEFEKLVAERAIELQKEMGDDDWEDEDDSSEDEEKEEEEVLKSDPTKHIWQMEPDEDDEMF